MHDINNNLIVNLTFLTMHLYGQVFQARSRSKRRGMLHPTYSLTLSDPQPLPLTVSRG